MTRREAGKRPRRQRIARWSLHQEVTDRLRDMIVEGKLTPGDRIPEGRLCDDFGVSRTPLREALKVLASEGLVEPIPNRGSRVTRITPEEVGELFEAVSGIERLAGELAAQRASEKDLSQLRDMQERMEGYHRTGRRPDYFRVNERIHRAIVDLADNSVLKATHETLMVRVRRARYLAIMSQERWDESVREHAAILGALVARDSDRAGALILRHVRRTGEVVRESFEAAGGNNMTHPSLEPASVEEVG